MANRPVIMGVGGTTRVGSLSETALRYVLGRCEAMGAETLLFAGADLPAEPYDPAQPDRSDKALALVAGCRRADGLIISTPAYHGGISGLIKNAIDYAEDMRDDAMPYFDGKVVGCVVCAAGPQAMGGTLASLRSIVHALRGWPTPYAATINSTERPFGADGQTASMGVGQALDTVAEQVMRFVGRQSA